MSYLNCLVQYEMYSVSSDSEMRSVAHEALLVDGETCELLIIMFFIVLIH